MVEIREAAANDCEAIAMLMCELSEFYKESALLSVTELAQIIRQELFGATRAGMVILAMEGNVAVGFLSYSFAWPAVGVTRELIIKELFVSRTFRRRGIGIALMRIATRAAVQYSCSRVVWQTERSNKAALAFYRKIAQKARLDNLCNNAKISLCLPSSHFGAFIN